MTPNPLLTALDADISFDADHERDEADSERSPITPRRLDPITDHTSLSVKVPPLSDNSTITSNPLIRPIHPAAREPPSTTYPAHITASLPRHSRGLDFSRACTNLHHSTLAESSPDSSPVILHRNAAHAQAISFHKPHGSSSATTENSGSSTSAWSAHSSNGTERVISSSSATANSHALASPASSESDDDDRIEDNDDSVFATPQVHRLSNPSFTHATSAVSTMSPIASGMLKSFQRTRLRRESSGQRLPGPFSSPKSASPPPLRNIDATHGYFGWPRPSSASATHDNSPFRSPDVDTPPFSAGPAVVKRAVTRRQNLLPKTKGFARIKAALEEEGAPVDTEVRREADTIRQVRERDTDSFDVRRSSLTPAGSSPGLLPAAVSGSDSNLDDIPEDGSMLLDQTSKAHARPSLGRHVPKTLGGIELWDRTDQDSRTTPPPNLRTRHSSSDTNMVHLDSPATNEQTTVTATATANHYPRSESIWSSSTITEDIHSHEPSGTIAPLKFNGKRSRAAMTSADDDLDIASIKRRAVSPSLSLQNSPIAAGPAAGPYSDHAHDRQGSLTWTKGVSSDVLAASVAGGILSKQSSLSEGQQDDRVGLAGHAPLVGFKRVGLQGMTDTSDGFMKMSIE